LYEVIVTAKVRGFEIMQIYVIHFGKKVKNEPGMERGEGNPRYACSSRPE
jgi:hypothetical protein